MKRSWPLLLGMLAYVVAVVVWLAVDKRVPREAFGDFSAENTSEKGLSLARRYLAARGRRVSLLERPIDVRYLPKDGVVIRAGEFMNFFDFVREMDEDEQKKDEEKKDAKAKKGDKTPPKQKKPEPKKPKLKLKRDVATPMLDSDEEEWVRGGGRLVLAPTREYGGLSLKGSPLPRATKVFPIWPGVETITEPTPRILAGDAVLRASHTLYTIGDAPAIARIPLGAGDVILLPAPELFTNEHIGGNLALLTALAGERRPVLFDELAHGQRSDDGVLPLMKDWNLGPFLLLGLLAFAVALWRNGVSIGPREDDFRDTRSEAVDLVDSLGALYERSMTNGDAIASYHHALTQAVAVQSGLRGDPLHKKVNELTAFTRVPGRGEKLDDETFRRSMGKINEAFSRIER